MKVGRVGILADYNERKEKPYLSIYNAESILNWMEDDGFLTEVHLVEESYVQDSFQEVKAERRIRRCYIDEEGFYSVEVYRVPVIGGTSKIELMATYQPF